MDSSNPNQQDGQGIQNSQPVAQDPQMPLPQPGVDVTQSIPQPLPPPIQLVDTTQSQPSQDPTATPQPAIEPVLPTIQAPTPEPVEASPVQPTPPTPEPTPISPDPVQPTEQSVTDDSHDSMQATMPLPTPPQEVQPTISTPSSGTKKGGINPWMIISFILLAVVAIGGVYLYMLSKNQSTQQAMRMAYPTQAVAPTVAVNLSPTPSGTMSAQTGKVAGTMCYPASGVPAGVITAKDTTSGKEYTQTYAGTGNGATTAYTFDLPVGAYHMKFTPAQYSTVIGFYTDYSSCVGNPSGANCSGQKLRPLLAATVSANLTTQNINLCDYYYPPSTPPQF